jgi:hypothetical protein
MKNPGKSSILALLVLMLIISAFGCQSKKKAMEAAYLAGEKARIEQEAAERKERDAETARKAAEAEARRNAEALSNETTDVAINTRVNNYFEATAQASTVAAANATIADALTLFASPQTPVLIVISEEGGQKDYDRPTTISEYLNYLKDQKKNSNRISNVKTDDAGKITEVEVRKPF